MATLEATTEDYATLVSNQAQQLTNNSLTIIALNRVVRELEAEVATLKPAEKAKK